MSAVNSLPGKASMLRRIERQNTAIWEQNVAISEALGLILCAFAGNKIEIPRDLLPRLGVIEKEPGLVIRV